MADIGLICICIWGIQGATKKVSADRGPCIIGLRSNPVIPLNATLDLSRIACETGRHALASNTPYPFWKKRHNPVDFRDRSTSWHKMLISKNWSWRFHYLMRQHVLKSHQPQLPLSYLIGSSCNLFLCDESSRKPDQASKQSLRYLLTCLLWVSPTAHEALGLAVFIPSRDAKGTPFAFWYPLPYHHENLSSRLAVDINVITHRSESDNLSRHLWSRGRPVAKSKSSKLAFLLDSFLCSTKKASWIASSKARSFSLPLNFSISLPVWAENLSGWYVCRDRLGK